jgi:alpha-L-fucosidase
MKNAIRILALFLSAVTSLATVAASADKAPDQATRTATPANAARLAWWRDARFGMFIHWGPVSLKGTEIGWSRGAPIPIAEYDNLYKQFNPVKFNADQWVKIAKDAGMKYMVFTTKHHDGFCMFDTRQGDFNVMNSPFGRDVVRELSEACRKQGIAFGTYYSVCDWHHPDFPFGSPGGSTKKPHPNLDRYEQYLRKQVEELVRNYGPLSTLWFDVSQGFDEKRGKGVVDFVRSLQPDILVNNRCSNPGDYDTPEQTVGTFRFDRPWETCMTICNQWAWKPNDPMKTLQQCIQTLVRCAGGDGNLLFNVGPMPTGEIEPRQVERLKEMGVWLAKYGESIYGTRGGPFKPNKQIASTRKRNTVYVHVLKWEGDCVALPPLPKKIIASSVLTGGTATIKQDPNGITISIPSLDRKAIDTIVKLELDGPALDIRPISLPTTIKATASNIYQQMDAYAPEMAFDGDPHTRWATDGGTKHAWIAIDLGKPVTLEGVKIVEEFPGRVEKFELQAKDGPEWKTFFSGTKLGHFSQKFPPVAAQHLRLNILQANEGPTISEIQWIEKRK